MSLSACRPFASLRVARGIYARHSSSSLGRCFHTRDRSRSIITFQYPRVAHRRLFTSSMKAAASPSEVPAEKDREAQELAAFNGEEFPSTDPWSIRYCYLVHGIRHHEDFMRSAEASKVFSNKDVPYFAKLIRAKNARLIMSNEIPQMSSEAEKPYCIWHPDVATEETYRSLAQRYPDMRYHVGRACAVAGYKTLYDELDLLPDVSIAEEARDNRHIDIFDAIVNQPVRYSVMNDYTRTVELENPRAGACLNGDTAVRSSLSRKLPKKFTLVRTADHYFDIQEDENVKPTLWPFTSCSVLDRRHTELAYTPLPRDLPALNKDVLIILAAWDGNFERYARLRRPVMVPNELTAILRGAHHHTPFARWLSTCVDDITRPGTHHNDIIWQAIHARSIMNGDLSRIDSETDGGRLPLLFWWPHHPHETTLRELVWRRPDLKHQVTLACIASSYQPLYNELTAGEEPTMQQLEMAVQSMNPHYREDVLRRAREHRIVLDIEDVCTENHDWGVAPWPEPTSWSRSYLRPNKEMWHGDSVPWMQMPLQNWPDRHNVDWDEGRWPDGDPLSLEMNLLMSKWMCSISAMEVEREVTALSRNISLYDDEEHRQTPGPEPTRPKDFEGEGYFP